jgi:diguanylate cyclase (GGDEF)-like protein
MSMYLEAPNAPHSPMDIHTPPKRNVRAAVTTTVIVLLGGGLTWALVYSETNAEPADVNWLLFGIISTLLIACERSPRSWIRFGPIGVVTPLWMFSYALILLGSPSAALGVALVGASVHAVTQREPVRAMLPRLGGVALSLATAGLMLFALRVQGPITVFETVPWDWALAIVVAGVTIVMLNVSIAAITAAVNRKISFLALLRRGMGVRITAEGALLSLAPIWVIGINFSVVIIPLLGITTVLVFRSTRQALERAHEAHHDPLTGLPNRRAYLDHLQDSLADPRASVAPTVLIMDLDGFKEINDRLGHQIGDSLLVAFADRLTGSLPAGGVAARLGGDEFAVLLVHQTSDEVLATLIQRFHRDLTAPLVVEGFPVTVGVSIGAAIGPGDGQTPADLLRAADVAMYKAKRTGSSLEMYASCVKTPQRGRLNLLSDLNDALDDHQLHLHFQPQIKMSDGSVDTVEALIRWVHPKHGMIPPDEFIGLAEQTDLIAPITDLVLRAATRGMLTDGTAGVRLAVNVSNRSLQDPYFATRVFTTLRKAGFPPERLELEVTERSIISNPERSTYTIDRLRSEGVRIAIDDFGVGYSSYRTLRLLDVDRVKIDRDFVRDLLVQPRDRLIVASLIELAHELGLDVVAEGVESTEVWNLLADLDCDVAQGFGIAVPMSFPDLRGWLSRWNHVTSVEHVAELPKRR